MAAFDAAGKATRDALEAGIKTTKQQAPLETKSQLKARAGLMDEAKVGVMEASPYSPAFYDKVNGLWRMDTTLVEGPSDVFSTNMGPPQIAGPDVTDQISHGVWDISHRAGDLTVHPRTGQAPEITSPPNLAQLNWSVNDKGWDISMPKP